MISQGQQRFPHGKPHDRGGHHGGGVEGVGRQQVLRRHDQGNGGLLGGGKVLGEGGNAKGHGQQGPKADRDAHHLRAVSRQGQHHRQGQHQQPAHHIGDHQHGLFLPSIDINSRQGTEQHRRNGEGDRDGGNPAADGLAGFLEPGSHDRDRHDQINLIRQLRKHLPTPQGQEVSIFQHRQESRFFGIGGGGFESFFLGQASCLDRCLVMARPMQHQFGQLVHLFREPFFQGQRLGGRLALVQFRWGRVGLGRSGGHGRSGKRWQAMESSWQWALNRWFVENYTKAGGARAVFR